MATWGVHLRIAGKLFDKIPEENRREFVIGAVAPDCGYGKKDSNGEFDPPPYVTHWSPSGMKHDCRYKDFANEYLTGERNDDYWFYLGYYIHLLTDIMWSVTVYMPTKRKYAKEFEHDPNFLRAIKKDWNDIDAAYFQSENRRPCYDIIRNAGEVKDYLPYYEHGQLTNQIKYVADYYMNYGDVTDREYIYISRTELDNFVSCASELVRLYIEKEKLI